MEKRKAFTLIELLVVISIIAMLMAILIPALKAAKAAATGAVCLNNVGSLSKAWFTYTIDNDDKLVGGDTPDNTSSPPFSRSDSGKDWVDPPIDLAGNYFGNSTKCTFEDEKRGIERGALFHYVKDTGAYHCPGDKRYRKPPADPLQVKQDGGFRSYSIPDCLNGDAKNRSTQKQNNIELYVQIKSPAEKYVFVEENDSRGFNRCSWTLDSVDKTPPWHWHDQLAAWHNKKSTLGWADCHATMHRWVDKRTIEMTKEEVRSIMDQIKLDQENNQDLLFMKQHYPHIGIMTE